MSNRKINIHGDSKTCTKIMDNLENGFALFQEELQQALQDNAWQAGKINKLSADLALETREKYSLSEQVDNLKAKLDVETSEKESLSDQVEDLQAKLKSESGEKWSLYDQVEYLKEQLEVEIEEKQSVSDEIEDLKTKLKVTNEEKQMLYSEVQDLKVKLEEETKEKLSLSRECEELQAKLEIETKEKQSMLAELEDLKSTLKSAAEEKHSLSERVEDLKAKLNVETKDKQSLLDEVKDLKSMLKMKVREKQSLLDDVEDLKAKLEVETREKQLLTDVVEDLKASNLKFKDELDEQQLDHALRCHMLHTELVDLKRDNFVLNQELKKEKDKHAHIQAEASRLSTKLKAETKKNESLSKEKECLITKLQKEQLWRLQLSEDLQKYEGTLHPTFHAENTVPETKAAYQMLEELQREVASLSIRLKNEVNENRGLYKRRDYEVHELRPEQNLNLLNLNNPSCAHQPQTKSPTQSSGEKTNLSHKVEHLKAANDKLATKLQIEEQLSYNFHVLTDRLSASLETETKKNKSLTAELHKELTWRQQLSDSFQKEKDTLQQQLQALHQKLKNQNIAQSDNLPSEEPEALEHVESEVCVERLPEKKKRTPVNQFFGWRKKNKVRKAGEEECSSN